MEYKTVGKEGASSQGPKKDDKLAKVNKKRGIDNKCPGKEKWEKADEVSNNFPNFNVLTEEERLAFFEALTAARKNIEQKGLPTRERFGTIHDQYLEYFNQDGKKEKIIEKKPESSCPVKSSWKSPITQSAKASVAEQRTDGKVVKSPKSPQPKKVPRPLPKISALESESINKCESVIKRDTEKMIQLYLQKKKRIEEQWRNSRDNKNPETKQIIHRSPKLKRNEWIQPEKPKTAIGTTGSRVIKTSEMVDRPQFHALNPEERKEFFKVLKKARDNILEKNPQKKNKILSINEVLQPYKTNLTTVCTAVEKRHKGKEGRKNLRVKVTLTSRDNERLSRTKSQVLTDTAKEGSEGRSKSLESVSADITREKQSKINVSKKTLLDKEECDDGDSATTATFKKSSEEFKETAREEKKQVKLNEIQEELKEMQEAEDQAKEDTSKEMKKIIVKAGSQKSKLIRKECEQNADFKSLGLVKLRAVSAERKKLDFKKLAKEKERRLEIAKEKKELLKKKAKEKEEKKMKEQQRRREKVEEVMAQEKDRSTGKFTQNFESEEAKLRDTLKKKTAETKESVENVKEGSMKEKEKQCSEKIEKSVEKTKECDKKSSEYSVKPVEKTEDVVNNVEKAEKECDERNLEDNEESVEKVEEGCDERSLKDSEESVERAEEECDERNLEDSEESVDKTKKDCNEKGSEHNVKVNYSCLSIKKEEETTTSEESLKQQGSTKSLRKTSSSEESQSSVENQPVKAESKSSVKFALKKAESCEDEVVATSGLFRSLSTGTFQSKSVSEKTMAIAIQPAVSPPGLNFMEGGVAEMKGVPTSVTNKVILVDDNVIEKIKNLIWYLENKVKPKDNLAKEYVSLLLNYIEYLTKVTESIVRKSAKGSQKVHSAYAVHEVHLKFKDKQNKNDNEPKEDARNIPRSISENDFPVNPPQTSGTEKKAKEKIQRKKSSVDNLIMSDSESSSNSENEVEHFAPTSFKKTGIPTSKIRLLQDLLKGRAGFVEGSIEDFKIVRFPEEEYVPEKKSEATKELKETDEEEVQKVIKMKFFRNLAKLCKCGKKEAEEDAILENLKGEAVRVDTIDKKKGPDSATINDSTMEVLKAAERKKIIEKYFKKDQS